MKKIKKFIKDSYTFSPLAFWCEMVEAIFLISASAILTFTVLDPATRIFIPLYFIGSILGVVSAVIRKAAFVIVLCSWFTIMNAIALIQLFII
jgi:hypothetical protein|tara:strand:+ start:491 stop:769 length:279 start_codon:yes stop_codon:yes gene_type:complete